MMLEILLVGVCHDFQWISPDFIRRLRPDAVEAYAQVRSRYEEWIRGCVREFGPLLIFDEMNLPEGATRERLCDTGRLWVYMDIPEDVRRKFGLIAFRTTLEDLWISGVDDVRENYWRVVIENMTAACRISRVLAICGSAHLASCEERLRDAGHVVSQKDMFAEGWCDLSWHPDPLTREYGEKRKQMPSQG